MSETPPDNGDAPAPVNPLDELEFGLPEPEEVPLAEVQERLEAPTFFQTYLDGSDAVVTVESGAATEPGVEKVWTEPDAVARRDDPELTAAAEAALRGEAGQ